CQKYTTSPLTF
nr:immunoglobulin light chain junction region [Macaca mulatta]